MGTTSKKKKWILLAVVVIVVIAAGFLVTAWSGLRRDLRATMNSSHEQIQNLKVSSKSLGQYQIAEAIWDKEVHVVQIAVKVPANENDMQVPEKIRFSQGDHTWESIWHRGASNLFGQYAILWIEDVQDISSIHVENIPAGAAVDLTK